MNNPMPEQLSILVVEDDPGDFGLLRQTLRLTGLADLTDAIVWATTLAEALTCVRQMKLPDIVLLDLALPDSGGLATLRSLRAAAPGLAIIVLTGHDDQVVATAALQAGALDYLVKGQIDHDALRRAVRNSLVRHRLERKVALTEARFRDFGSANSDWWFWEMNAQLRFSWFSPNAQQAIGRAPDTLLGQRREDIAQVPEADKEVWASHLDGLAQYRALKQIEYCIGLPGGGEQWRCISGVTCFDAAGAFEG